MSEETINYLIVIEYHPMTLSLDRDTVRRTLTNYVVAAKQEIKQKYNNQITVTNHIRTVPSLVAYSKKKDFEKIFGVKVTGKNHKRLEGTVKVPKDLAELVRTVELDNDVQVTND
ncbi:hypothetical protein COV11_03130 [Candidatus Woesearchaeota archaeon CG10_big_fil_rev_8_21_14_0_10_30_7]|nr:MAG: hypothetical protein COV11_03130 [Candidatus Woesearchaeota archaeon CG10_big_fil_rev_8_21_14_0_10_30_7]